MSVIVSPRTEDSLQELKAICTVTGPKGLKYPYNTTTKVIEMQELETDNVEVFSIASRALMAIPFDIAMKFLQRSGVLHDFEKIGDNEKMIFAGKLRDYQENDLKSIILQLKTKGCCYFKAFPGYGKTVLISYIISIFKEKACIVVPNVPLAIQTKKSVEMMLPGINVFIMGTDRVIPEETDVVICFVRRINGTSAPFINFKTIIFDEVHMLSTSHGIAAMLTLRPSRLLALTATAGERNNITELFVGKCTIEPSIKKQWYITFPRIKTGLDGEGFFGVDGYTKAINALTTSKLYMLTAIKMIKYWVYMQKRIIVITMRREARDMIAELLKEDNSRIERQKEIAKLLQGNTNEKSENTDKKLEKSSSQTCKNPKRSFTRDELEKLFRDKEIPFVNKTPEEIITSFEEENEITYGVLTSSNRKCGNCNVIIGTHKLIGTGFDLSNSVEDFDGKAAGVMLFLGSIKDETLMHQASGRSFRDESSLAVYLSVAEIKTFTRHTEELRHVAKNIDGCVILDRYARFLEHFNEEAEKELTTQA